MMLAGAGWQDIHYAFRSLRRNPAFMATAVVTLALGIGANTAVFSVVNAVLLQPLSYPDPDRLVQLVLASPDGPGIILSPAEFVFLGAQTQTFQDISAYDFGGPGINLTGRLSNNDRPERLRGIHVSQNYFRLFGAKIVLGRSFTAEEDRVGGGKVAVISDGLWRRRFHADPNFIGKPISLGGEPYIVAGVTGPEFQPDPAADIWLPLQSDPNGRSMLHYMRIAARLKPGVTAAAAKAELKLATAVFRRSFPLFNAKAEFTIWPLRDTVVRDVREALLILLGTVTLVLLIACANVANLLLARATSRQREMAIRVAIGASRARIARQLLTESLVLAGVGGALGLLLGYAGIRALLAMSAGNLPRVGESGSPVALDWRVLAFTLAISLVTGILFGLAPALNATRMVGLKPPSGNRARSMFVVAEVALALVLLIGAGLLIRTFAALRAVQPGFDSHDVLTFEMSLAGSRFEKTAAVNQMVREAEQRLGALPGVKAVASSWMLPIENAFSSTFVIEGRPLNNGPVHGGALMRPVSPQYFDVFRIPLLRGRLFTDRDTSNANGVVLISEGMAKKYWPDNNPIGEKLNIDKYHPEFSAPPRTIIGIVGDVRNYGINREPDPSMYLPQAQIVDGMTAIDARILPLTWVVRTKAESSSLTAAIEEQLRQASGGLAVGHVRTMEQVVGRSLAQSDFNTLLLTIFAAIALLLAAIGVYGLMNYAVEQRTQEIGVRMALGATPRQVRNGVVLAGMRLALTGVALGVAAALALTRLMEGLVYGVKTSDARVFVAVPLLLMVVTLAATYLPSRRATKIDPVEALRWQ